MIKNCQEKKGREKKKQKAKTVNIYFIFFWMHNKYTQQIMQKGEWESYRQQDAKLLSYSGTEGTRHATTTNAGKGLGTNTPLSRHMEGLFLVLISGEQHKTPQRSVPPTRLVICLTATLEVSS